MVNKINPEESKLIRDYVENVCGISYGVEKEYLIESRFANLLEECKCNTFAEFYRHIQKNPNLPFRDRIIDAITTKETLWFRDEHPFVILEEILLPTLTKKIISGEKKGIRIWSAGCSTGQEPYSIAMVIEKYCRAHSFLKPHHFEILATDISSSAIETANKGQYDQLSIQRGLSAENRERYFYKHKNTWEIDSKIKQRVTFRKINLLDSFVSLGKFDVIFMRYVAIYFADSLKNKILGDFTRLLSPSGYLLLGASESLLNSRDQLECLCHSGGLYYRYTL